MSREDSRFALMGPIVREETQMSLVRVVIVAALAASVALPAAARKGNGAPLVGPLAQSVEQLTFNQ